MNKYSSIIIAICLSMLTLGCGREIITAEDLVIDYKRYSPEKIDTLSVVDIKANPDLIGIDVTLKLIPDANEKSIKNIYQKTFDNLIRSHLCKKNGIIYPYNKFINKNHYVNYILLDSNNSQFHLLKATLSICEGVTEKKAFDFITEEKKQKEQGFYDEKFLKRVYLPKMKANLPKKITNEIEMYDVIIGPGSKLSLITKYTPQNENEDYADSIEKANMILQKMYYAACANTNTRHLLSMIDKTTWIATYKDQNNKVLTSIVASKTCQ